METEDPHSSQQEGLAVTPAGHRWRSRVRAANPGQAVDFGQGPDPVMAADVPNLNAPGELVLTPGGFRHVSLVHQVDAGGAGDLKKSAVRLLNVETKAVVADIPAAPATPGVVPALGSGWIAYA